MNYKAILFFSLVLLLSACGGDDAPLSERIVGTWILTFTDISGCDDPDDNMVLVMPDSDGCFELNSQIICNFTLVFSDDGTGIGTFTENGDSREENFTYTVNDTDESFSFCETPSSCHTMTSSGDTMTRSETNSPSPGCTTRVKYTKV